MNLLLHGRLNFECIPVHKKCMFLNSEKCLPSNYNIKRADYIQIISDIVVPFLIFVVHSRDGKMCKLRTNKTRLPSAHLIRTNRYEQQWHDLTCQQHGNQEQIGKKTARNDASKNNLGFACQKLQYFIDRIFFFFNVKNK